MKFRQLAEYFQKLEETASRNEITEILADLFKKSDSNEIDKIIYLLLGRLAPNYENIVFNLADRMMVLALAEAYSVDVKEVRKLYTKTGDMGNVAENLSRTITTMATVNQVYQRLRSIAEDEGTGSQERKINGIARVLGSLDPISAKFVARIPIGKLRLGFSDKTIIDALSIMTIGDKSAKREIEKSYEVLPDIGKLAQNIKANGLKNISQPNPTFGVPIVPMLAQRLKSPTEMIKKMEKVAVEPKFDGLRVQIHFQRNKKTRAFTRNLNDISDMFPELQQIEKYIKVKSAIFDSEAVGLDPSTQKMVDFQHTMKRRRKHNIEHHAGNIPLRFQIFDVLSVDNKSVMGEDYLKRRETLNKIITKNKLLVIDDYIITNNPSVITKRHKQLLNQGLEGVIVKSINSEYVPGRTGWRWVKMKQEEQSVGKLSDTVDCVIMGYSSGKGKRADFGIGKFLAGVRKGDNFVSVTKVGTGLTDEVLIALAKRLKKLTINKKPKNYEVHKNHVPNYWVEPEVVVELAGDDMTKSPTHTAGYALRFPRLVKFRDDKSPKQATTVGELKKLYNLQ